jgi:hypothetical protein
MHRARSDRGPHRTHGTLSVSFAPVGAAPLRTNLVFGGSQSPRKSATSTWRSGSKSRWNRRSCQQQAQRVGRPLEVSRVGMDEDAEGVTAEARQHVVACAPFLQQLRRQQEQTVAGLAALAAVDRCQVVKIDGDDSEVGRAVPDGEGCPSDFDRHAPGLELGLAYRVVEPRSVDQPRERVEVRWPTDA